MNQSNVISAAALLAACALLADYAVLRVASPNEIDALQTCLLRFKG